MAINIITGFFSSSQEALDKRSGPYEDGLATLPLDDIEKYVGQIIIFKTLDPTNPAIGNVTLKVFDGGISEGDLKTIYPLSIPDPQVDWGEIYGDLSHQADLWAALTAKYDKSYHIDISTGVPDAGRPIVLNSQGLIDTSMLDASTFYYVGPWTPTSGSEYPDNTGETHGAFWAVQGLSGDYTFVDPGDLLGETVSNGDFLVWGTGGWSIMVGEMNPLLYMKLDKSTSLTNNNDPLSVFGKVINVVPGTVTGEAIEYGQWNFENTNLESDINRRVLIAGDTMTGDLIINHPGTTSKVIVKAGPSRHGYLSIYDHVDNELGAFGWIDNEGDDMLGIVRFDTATGDIVNKIELHGGGNIGVLATAAPTQPTHLTPKSYVDAGVNRKEDLLGVPTSDGMILSSTVAGVRSWISAPNSAVWGSITGTLANQTDLQDALDLKANISHIHAISDITDLQTSLDGKAPNLHNHSIHDITDLDNQLGDRYTKGAHIYQRTDINNPGADAFKPTTLNANGYYDPSLLDSNIFYPVADWDPSDPDGPNDDNTGCDPIYGCEYPDTTGQAFGAFWLIHELLNPTGTYPGPPIKDYYTFTSGSLNGRSAREGDFMVLTSTGWSIMAGEMNPRLYYKLDGSQSLTAPFAGGGQPLVNIADGTGAKDAVTLQQLNTRVLKSGDTMTGKLTVNNTIQSYNIKVGDGTSGNSLSIRGNSTDQNAYLRFRRPDDTDAGWLYLNDAEDHINLKVLDDNEVELSTFGFLRDGNISVSGTAPTEIDHLTRRDYVDGRFNDRAPLVHTHAVRSQMVLENDLIAAHTVGGVSAGTTIPSGTPLEEVFEMILVLINPEITSYETVVIVSPFSSYYEVGQALSDSLSIDSTLGIITDGDGSTTHPLKGGVTSESYTSSDPNIIIDVGGNVSGNLPNGAVTIEGAVEFSAGTEPYFADRNGTPVPSNILDGPRGAETVIDDIVITGIFPKLFGMSATDLAADPANAYADLSKDTTPVENGTKGYNITGSNAYIYFIVPDGKIITKILDGNNFDVTSSFSLTEQTIVGPTWSSTMNMYKTNSLTSVDPAQTYTVTFADE